MDKELQDKIDALRAEMSRLTIQETKTYRALSMALEVRKLERELERSKKVIHVEH